MDNTLWKKIMEFDLDHPMSEYGFSTRLAIENFWTIDFTQKAIVEYKKFMYLAGTSDLMVSPSEIIDVVWHQHLIFTQSYSDLCAIIGKNIQHIPSTHNKEDFEKFKLAKQRTKKLYHDTFGEQPQEIWEFSDMYESLALPKAKFKVRTFIIFGILILLALITPFYFLLRPLYVQINSGDFLTGYAVLLGVALIGLKIFNSTYLFQVVRNFKSYTFLHSLRPQELVYLKTQKLANVVHGSVNQLIQENVLSVKNEKLYIKSEDAPANIEAFTILETIKSVGTGNYPPILKRLIDKPVFNVVSNAMDAFKKYVIKSQSFGKLFYWNFIILSVIMLLGLVRLTTGIIREKPIDLIAMLLLITLAFTSIHLIRLSTLVVTNIVPKFYRNEVLPTREETKSWDWQYFLMGSALLSTSFIPMVNYTNRNDFGSSSDSGGSCSSGCGSSCSSCGGCGGGD